MFGNSRGGFLQMIPPVTKNLLIINVLMLAVMYLVPNFEGIMTRTLALHYWDSPDFNPAQLVTYMFLHAGFTHLFFNMFSLFMFGRMLESVWGSKRFFIFYFVCGIGAALVQEMSAMISIIYAQNHLPEEAIRMVVNEGYSVFQQGMTYTDEYCRMIHQAMYTPVVGASGAIFSVLLGFAFVFPNMPLYMMFIPVPIKAKWMVMGYAVLEFFFGVSGTMASVAHFAHLGGMLFGLLLLLYWKKKGILGGGTFY